MVQFRKEWKVKKSDSIQEGIKGRKKYLRSRFSKPYILRKKPELPFSVRKE